MLLPNEELLRRKIEVFKQAGLPEAVEEEEAKLAMLMEHQPSIKRIDGLQAVEEVLGKHFKITDWQGVYIIFGAAAALYISGEMVWLRIVGASRSGKTELLRAIAAHKDTKEMGSLTPSALRGGLKEKQSKMLGELTGHRVVTLDLAGLLTTRREARNEVFGLLRLVKDGRLVSDFGSHEGHLTQETKFDWLMATTPYFEQVRVMESLLGERFIDLWWIPADREEMAIQAAENNQRLPGIRNTLAELVGSMLDTAKSRSSKVDVSRVDNTWIGRIANLAALLRTPIVKDWKGNITAIPLPEIGTDLAQSFQKIALGLQLLGIDDYKPYIMRLVRDCMPSVRRALITKLVKEQATTEGLASAIPLPVSTVRYHLDDLESLSVITRIGNTNTYRIKAELAEKMRSTWN